MQKELVYKQAAFRMLHFQPEIKIQYFDSDFFDKIIDADPRVLFYYKSLHYSVVGSTATLTMQYQNTDVPVEKIKVLDNKIDELMICDAISNYEPYLVVVFKRKSDITWRLHKFNESMQSFYSNYKGYSWTEWEYSKYSCYKMDFKYRVNTTWLKAIENKITGKIGELKPLLLADCYPDEVKCFLVHNFLASTVTYHQNENAKPIERSYLQSAYGALIIHKCVCQGYAEAFKRFLDAAGIKCKLITGIVYDDATKKELGYHSWNMVYFEKYGYYTAVDVTWDSHDGKSYDEHFLKSDDFYLPTREWNRYLYGCCKEGREIRKAIDDYISSNYDKMIAAGLKPEWLKQEKR